MAGELPDPQEQQRKAEVQTEVVRLVADLHSLDFKDTRKVMEWLEKCTVAESVDATNFPRKEALDLFSKAGFSASYFGEVKDWDQIAADPEKTARCVVSEFMEQWQQDSHNTPHPSVFMTIDRWLGIFKPTEEEGGPKLIPEVRFLGNAEQMARAGLKKAKEENGVVYLVLPGCKLIIRPEDTVESLLEIIERIHN